MKYRKKPVVVEAWQWDGNLLEDCKDVPQWIWDMEEESDLNLFDDLEPEDRFIQIETYGVTYDVRPGDYIILDMRGEIHTCSADDFEQTYEEAEHE